MTAIEIQFEEYCDCLLTIELAVKLAQIDRRSINKTIRDSWSVIRKRMECAANIAIFDGLCKQPFPDGALKMVRRQLNQVGGGRLGSLLDKMTCPVSINADCNVDSVVLLMRPSLKCADVVAYGFKGCIEGLSEDM